MASRVLSYPMIKQSSGLPHQPLLLSVVLPNPNHIPNISEIVETPLSGGNNPVRVANRAELGSKEVNDHSITLGSKPRDLSKKVLCATPASSPRGTRHAFVQGLSILFRREQHITAN